MHSGSSVYSRKEQFRYLGNGVNGGQLYVVHRIHRGRLPAGSIHLRKPMAAASRTRRCT